MSRIRVRALYTRYAHFGPYAGFHQVFRHLSTPRIIVDATPVRDGTPIDTALQAVSRASPRSWYKSTDLAAEIGLAFGALTNRFDIVHYLDAEHSLGFFPRFARARGSAARIIGTFHQPPERLQGLVSRDAVAALDLVMVMSPTQEEFFRNWLPPERVRTFLHGVETDFFKPSAAEFPRSTFRCVTVGHWLRDWPAIGAVMDRLRADPTLEFHVVTNRETGLEGRERVVMHRGVSDEALLRLYQTSDLLLLPLTSATANNSLLEGLACGLPVVSTDIPAVRAYVGEGPAALVAGNRADALAEAIVAIREDDGRRAAMGRAARARAEALSWRKRTAVLVEIYEELARP